MAEKCLSFDGIDDYATVLDDDSLEPTDDLSVEAWVKRSSSGEIDLIVSKRYDADRNAPYELMVKADNKPAFWVGNGTTTLQFTSSVTIDSNWHYLAGVIEGTNVKLYVDAVERASDTFSGIRQTNAAKVFIGVYPDENVPYSNNPFYFNGLIDEIRISSKARSLAEIQAIWNGGNGVQFEVDADTEALWHFNEGTGDSFLDETANDNDGTKTGASWVDGYVFSPSVTEKIDSDTGSGSELKTLTATLSKSDSGSGLESLLLDAAYILSEVGQGTGAASIILTGADAGNGVEALTNLISALTRIETGSGIEAVTSRCFTHSDSGQGIDDLASLMNSVLSGETASGADTTIALLSALATTEIGSGIDGLLGRVLSLIDTGSGLDVATLYKALFAADSGTGIEALAILLALTSSSEAGSGADLLRAKIEHTAGGDIKLPSGGQTSIPSRKVGI